METDSGSGWQGRGALEDFLRERIRATSKTIIEEELEAALGAAKSQRVGSERAGYRHGKRARRLMTSLGTTTITMPRGRASKKSSKLAPPARSPRQRHIGVTGGLQCFDIPEGEAILARRALTDSANIHAPILRAGPYSTSVVAQTGSGQ
jgi:Transposase, Mutator family